ncbi:putative DNA methyltransferase [Octadecabacter antarcticus 307]|uniref:site-specific DNA-methyltransferase (adenine-specific) n=1 Tax=Octadecabacter antarcticus 307 TaxID=391626 RepID=M9R443_9RHOB|nr:DNA methyltransferase [Octadecabacter antarcticus]AGI66523.1 putative DNA methyltransferase [Octadecabacter antarcticus 307]
MKKLTISYRPLSEVAVNPRNARTHDKRQLKQIKDSIEAFGFANPLLVDEAGVLIAGHGRLSAAKSLGLETVPIIVLEHLAETQKRALMLADNKIALNASWDMDLLANELVDLSSMDLEFDMELTGFEVADIDIIIGDAQVRGAEEVETAPVPNEDMPVVTRRGDLWLLGKHRIFCGDARSADDFVALVGDGKAAMVFTDPPYNVPIVGHVSGKGKACHREFHEASGEMTRSGFAAFLDEVLANTAHSCRDGAISFVCMDWRHMGELLEAGQRAFDAYLNLCVWAKTNGGMGSLYRSQHELVFVFRKGKAQHRNNVQLGRFGRNRTNVWTYAGVNTFREGRMEELSAHPTAKPVAMVKDAILDVTKRGEVVLDPFLGGGATLIAAEQSGRHCQKKTC